jgi:predicted permease
VPVKIVSGVARDLRGAFRALHKRPIVTIIVLLSLAFGVGANVALFSLINAILLRPLPVASPSTLYMPVRGDLGYRPANLFSFPLYRELRKHSGIFDESFAYFPRTFHIRSGSSFYQARGAYVTGNYYAVLRIQPILGRPLTNDDDHPGSPPVGVVGYSFWKGRLGGRVDIIGTILYIDDIPVRIVGVEPPSFFGMEVGRRDDVTVPASVVDETMPASNVLSRWSFNAWNVFGRLAPGLTLHQASERLQFLWPELLSAAGQPPDKREYVSIVPANKGLSDLRESYAHALFLLFIVVFAVLVIACLNIANVLLAQATARQHEFAVRIAIGASQWVVARQLILESSVLAIGGALLGLAMAYSINPLLISLFSTWRDPVALAIEPDRTVLVATGLLAVFITILIGVLPALKPLTVRDDAALAVGSRITVSRSQRFLSRALVVTEIAIAFVLSITGVLFLKSLHNLYNSAALMRGKQVIILRVEAGRVPLNKRRLLQIVNGVRNSLLGEPHIDSLAFSSFSPFIGGNMTDAVVAGSTVSAERLRVFINKITPSFVSLFGASLLAGRNFADRDASRSNAPIIINEELARALFPDVNPIGRQISLVYMGGPYEVVGVISNMQYKSYRARPTNQVYFPLLADTKGPVFLTIAVQVDSSRQSGEVARSISRTISRLDPDAFVVAAELQKLIDDSMLQEKLLTLVSAVLGGIAVGLAAVGIYGLLLYSVNRRIPEIGIRMALGADKWQVQWLVIKEALMLVALAVLLGLPLFGILIHQASGMLVKVSAFDIATISEGVILLIAIAVAAASVPAYMASTVDPQTALRYE